MKQEEKYLLKNKAFGMAVNISEDNFKYIGSTGRTYKFKSNGVTILISKKAFRENKT